MSWPRLLAALLVVVILGALATVVLREESGPGTASRSRRPPRPLVPASASSLVPDRPPPPVPSNVVAARQRDLVLPLPGTPPQRLAFSAHHLLRVFRDRVEVMALPSRDVVVTSPSRAPRAVVRLARGGGLAVVAAEATLSWPLGAKAVETRPRVPFLPGSQLLPDRTSARGFWLFHQLASAAHRHGLDEAPIAGALPVQEILELDAFDGRAVALLKDGAFVYTAGSRLVRHHPTSRPRSAAVLPEDPAHAEGAAAVVPAVIRLVPDRRVDRVWVVFDDARIWLVQVNPAFQVVQRERLKASPFALVRGGRRLVALTVAHQPGTPRRWHLEVFDLAMKATGSYPVAPMVGFRRSRGWVQFAVENRDLAVSSDGRYAAVGGPEQLQLWDLEAGRRLAN